VPRKVPRRNLAISRGQTISVKRGILVAPREWARTIDRTGNNRRIAARHSVPFKNQYTFAGLQPRIAFQVVVMRNGKVTRVLRECNRAVTAAPDLTSPASSEWSFCVSRLHRSTLRCVRDQFLVGKTLVPQEGFEPPTPSLRRLMAKTAHGGWGGHGPDKGRPNRLFDI
jgi:hypothetical protein